MAGAGHPRSDLAADYDGNWSVLIINKEGDCDRAYRYAVGVANGQVRHQGDAAAINMSGTVTPAGLVKVSMRLGEKGADGTGHLSASSGVGTWRRAGASGAACMGRWEAERREIVLYPNAKRRPRGASGAFEMPALIYSAHDLIRKPVPSPEQAEDMLFEIMR